jgi:hypothetical protein
VTYPVVSTEKGRVKIVLTSIDGDSVSVDCIHPSGEIRRVRGMDRTPLSGGAFIGYDYEAPIGLDLTYIATVWNDPDTQVATSDAVSVRWDTTQDWLKDPLEPVRNMPIKVVDPGDAEYDTPTGVHVVLGRPAPVTVATVRQASQGTFTFLTETRDERIRLHNLLASGNPLLFQSTQDSDIGNLYFAPLKTTQQRIVTLKTAQEYEWQIAYQEVDPPAGDPSAFTTWADVAAVYPTWQALIDANPGKSWLDFIESFDSLNSTPITTWRGG